MMDCITVENMRLSDAYTIEHITPSLELMHRAAYGVYLAHKWSGPVAIVCGSGNNGGDGFALACILHKEGIPCRIYTLSEKLSADSAYYADMAKKASVPVFPYTPGCLKDCDMLADCLLGTGFQGSVRGLYRSAIEEINSSNAFVVSADINSGMNGDTGDAELAVRSDVTVTIGYVKTGLVSENAGNYMKRLVCADIGIVLVEDEGDIVNPPHWLDTAVIDVRI
jgi:NAD(P)H-hydrate epimerase